MAKKVILKDDNVEIMPITRGELVLDSSGQLAFHSSQFLATQSLPGLMSAADKTKLDAIKSTTIDSALSTTSDNAVKNKVVTAAINEAKTLANNAQDAADDALDTANSAQGIANAIKSSYLKSASVSGNLLTLTDLDNEETKFNNTTYTFDSGSNGSFTVTPAGGEALTITVGGVLTDDKVKQTNTTSSGSYRLLFSYTADNTTRTEGARKSSKLLFNPSTGALTATSFSGKLAWTNLTDVPESFTPSIHNHSTSQIDALTNYSKATSVGALAATDTLNAALGKLEYKLDIAYDLVTKANDNDGTIENLKEILDVLSDISDTDTISNIIGKYLPLAGGTMTGNILLTTGSSSIRTNKDLVILAATNSNSYSGVANGTNTIVLGNLSFLTLLRSNDSDIKHYRKSESYSVLDAYNYSSYLPFLNSSTTHATKTSVIYAPTTAGTSGLFLVSSGSGAPTWNFAPVVSSSADGFAPQVITSNDATIGSAYYLLASTDGSATPSWYKLPASAFKSGTVTSVTLTQGTGITISNSGSAITSSGTRTISLNTAKTDTIGGIKIYKDNSSYTVTTNTSSISANVTSAGKYYGVEIDKDDKAFVYVPWTDTKVTAVDNHYTPSGGAAVTPVASGSTLSFGGAVVTGVTIDAAGHITGVSTSKLPSNPNSNTIPSAYCTTGASTAAKAASCTNYTLKDNSYIHVLISTTNTAASALTLNINSKGAKAIYINGTASSASNYTLPAGTYIVFYDGTNYYFRTDNILPGTIEKTISIAGGDQGSIPYQTAAGTTAFLSGSNTNNYVLRYDTSTKAPKWAAETTYSVVSSSGDGLAPKVISTNSDTVGSAYYVLASTNGSATPSWYKLPAGAFKTGTVTSITVTGSNGLSGTGTITTSGTITLSNAGVRSVTIGTGDNTNKLAVNTGGTSTYLTIPYATTSSNGVFYIAGTGTTEGTWLGDHAGIGSYYTGLTVAYKVPIAGASTTTLNINNLGAKTCYISTAKLTTHYGVGAVVILVYDGTYFRVADYDSNTNTQIRIYRLNTGYNADYPLIASRTAASSIGTSGTNSSYTSVYGVMWDDTAKVPTLNPSTGEIKAVKFTGILNGTANKVANSLILKIKSGSTEGTSLYTYDGSAGKTLDIVAGNNVTLTAAAGKLTIASSHVTYTLSGALNGNTFVSTLKPSSGDNTTSVVPAMTAATASAAGKAGLVPAPSAGSLNSFLRGDGTWVNVDAGTVISLPKELTVTADWMDTGIDGDDLETGTYIVLVSCAANNDALGYDCYWSGIMSWWKGRTNDTESDEILLHRTGRSYANTIYLRTIMRSNTDTNGLKLQIAANTNIGTKYTYTFKFKKVI